MHRFRPPSLYRVKIERSKDLIWCFPLNISVNWKLNYKKVFQLHGLGFPIFSLIFCGEPLQWIRELRYELKFIFYSLLFFGEILQLIMVINPDGGGGCYHYPLLWFFLNNLLTACIRTLKFLHFFNIIVVNFRAKHYIFEKPLKNDVITCVTINICPKLK